MTSVTTMPQDTHQLVKTVKKVEMVAGRLRLRQGRETMSSASASHIVDPSLSLVEKARILKTRASRIARRLQAEKSDSDATASTSESFISCSDFALMLRNRESLEYKALAVREMNTPSTIKRHDQVRKSSAW